MPFTYEYYFVNRGKTRDDHQKINNEIWLDVGGFIEEGTFDHHNCSKGYVSTIDVLIHELDLLEATKLLLDETQSVRIYLHSNPDVDALFSTYYLMYYLDYGRDAFESRFINSKLGDYINNYVNDIDSGRRKNIEFATLYNLVCHLDKLSGKVMDEALKWIDVAVRCIEENPVFNLYDWDLPLDLCGEAAEKIMNEVQQVARYNYERDKKENRLVIKNISIWTKDGDIETVNAAIWKEMPLSPGSAYIFARQEGAIVTFVPHDEYGNNAARISINPNIKGAVEKYSLTEVAEMYEQLEQIYDRKQLKETGILRRDYSRPRADERSKIFLDKPFSLTMDPWYVSVNGDMVDAPGSGSLIPIDVMIDVLENITKMVKCTHMVDFGLDLTKGINRPVVSLRKVKCESLRAWTRDMKVKLSKVKDDVYPLVIVEVDAALISHNYDILDAYFMSICDGAYVDAENKNVLHFDYRTHLYVNQANAVLFVATSNKTGSDIQMNGLLDWSSDAAVESSAIVEIFAKILCQREKFKELGRFLGDFKKHDKEIQKKNEELIALLAQAQAEQCIDSQVELNTFKFVYEALDVSELRETVKETMKLVSEYSKERVYANLNFLSLISIPFVLVSTLLQIGLFRFKPLVNLDVDNAVIPVVIPWLISLAVVIVITIFFYNRRKK